MNVMWVNGILVTGIICEQSFGTQKALEKLERVPNPFFVKRGLIYTSFQEVDCGRSLEHIPKISDQISRDNMYLTGSSIR